MSQDGSHDIWPAFKDFLVDALGHIERSISQQPPPLTTTTEVRRESGRTEFSHGLGVDLTVLVFRQFRELSALNSYLRLIDQIEASPIGSHLLVDGAGQPLKERPWRERMFLNFFAMPFLIQYIGSELRFQIQDDAAVQLLDEIIEAATAQQFSYSIGYFLYNVECQAAEMTLGNATIRRVEDEELAFLLREPGTSISRFNVSSVSAVAELQVSISRDTFPRLPDDAYGSLDRIVTALRILRSGDVGVAAVITRPLQRVYGGSGGTTLRYGGPPAMAGEPYRISADDAAAILALQQALDNMPTPAALRVAVDRFNLSYDRRLPADKIIDHWISLEAMFLQDSELELSYKAAMRIAAYLAEGQDARRELFERVRDSYKVRSKIVHGESLSGQTDVAMTERDTQAFLRSALQTAVHDPNSLSPRRLDDRLLA